MKTITHESIDYSFDNRDSVNGKGHALRKAFISGVEFAQQWIDVVIEQPEPSEKERIPYMSEKVLIKVQTGTKDEGYIKLSNYNTKRERFENIAFPEYVTHWRPIERK